MKRNIIRWSLCCMTLFCWTACENTGLLYDTEQKGTLYSDVKSTVKSFVFELGEEMEYKIPIQLMGMPKEYERSYELEFSLQENLTEWSAGGVTYPVVQARNGIDFTVGKQTFAAHAVVDTIRFTLHRSDFIKNKYAQVYFRIKENDQFIGLHDQYLSFFITDGEVTMPDWWYNGVNGAARVDGWQMYIGKFYPEKFRRMLQYYWDMEQSAPLFYADVVETYGKYLDSPTITAGFYQKDYPAVWAKYVLIPLYEYYKENPIPGDAVMAESGNQGEYWRNPVALYR